MQEITLDYPYSSACTIPNIRVLGFFFPCDSCSELPVISVPGRGSPIAGQYQGWLTGPPHYTCCAGVWPVSGVCVCYHLWYQLRLGGTEVITELAEFGWCESAEYP